MREKDDVIKEAKEKGERTHIGNLMTICSEKFAEVKRAVQDP